MKVYSVSVEIEIEADHEVTASDKVNDILAEAQKRAELKSYIINFADEA